MDFKKAQSCVSLCEKVHETAECAYLYHNWSKIISDIEQPAEVMLNILQSKKQVAFMGWRHRGCISFAFIHRFILR
jgi:hypothetical protein